MGCYDPSTSILAGMPDADKRAWLAALQTAYLELTAGKQVASVSYAMGDGSRSATYRQTDLATVVSTIRLLQRDLGIVEEGRSAIGVTFR